MRVWVYGDSPEQVQNMIAENTDSIDDTVAGVSVRARAGSTFPCCGLTPAMSAAIRGEFDVLLIPALTLLGNKAKADQTVELLRSYGVSVKSASN